MTNEIPTASRPKRVRLRTRYHLAAECLAVLDGEIAKNAASGPGVAISRPQTLNLLLERAVQCRCDAETRPLPTVPPDATGSALEVDTFAHDLLRIHTQRISETRPMRLNRCQVLRLLLLRVARCTCGPTSFRPVEDEAPLDPRARAQLAAEWVNKERGPK